VSLFSEPFRDRAFEALLKLPAAPLFPYPGFAEFDFDMTKGSLVIAECSVENRQRWTIRASYSSVGVFMNVLPAPES